MSNPLISCHATSEARKGVPFFFPTSALAPSPEINPPAKGQGGKRTDDLSIRRSPVSRVHTKVLVDTPQFVNRLYCPKLSRRENLGKASKVFQASYGDEEERQSPHSAGWLLRLSEFSSPRAEGRGVEGWGLRQLIRIGHV